MRVEDWRCMPCRRVGGARCENVETDCPRAAVAMLQYRPYSRLGARDVGKVKARLAWYAEKYPNGEWPGQTWKYPKVHIDPKGFVRVG